MKEVRAIQWKLSSLVGIYKPQKYDLKDTMPLFLRQDLVAMMRNVSCAFWMSPCDDTKKVTNKVFSLFCFLISVLRQQSI